MGDGRWGMIMLREDVAVMAWAVLHLLSLQSEMSIWYCLLYVEIDVLRLAERERVGDMSRLSKYCKVWRLGAER